MAHDVYICYDERDLETAKKVCDTLEDNGLDCWLKNRDTGAKRMVDEIMDAIKKSKVMVLLFSKNSKDSNFVNNEVDIAFAQKRSILVFQIDDSKLDGGLEFFLRNKPRIEAFPNPEDEFDRLIENTSKMVKEQGAIDRNIFKIIKDHKVPVIIGIVVILLVVGVLGYMAYNGGGSQTNATKIKAGDIKINITDFHVDDVRKEKTNWNYSYYVDGKITPAPGENDGFVILVDFYDESGNLVDTVDTPFKEAEKVKSGFLLGSTVSDKNNIKIADVQLVNKNNMVIAQDEAQL